MVGGLDDRHVLAQQHAVQALEILHRAFDFQTVVLQVDHTPAELALCIGLGLNERDVVVFLAKRQKHPFLAPGRNLHAQNVFVPGRGGEWVGNKQGQVCAADARLDVGDLRLRVGVHGGSAFSVDGLRVGLDRRFERRPGDRRDLAERAPLFEPAVATVGGAKQVAVFGACKHQGAISRMGAKRPYR